MSNKVIKVLSIDGGGIRGLIPALVLAEIEKRTDKTIAENFDLIAGTSTGGLLALALNVKGEDGKPMYSAEDLVKIYRDQGKEIFTPRKRTFMEKLIVNTGLGNKFFKIKTEKYGIEGLKNILEKYFSNRVLSDTYKHTLITSYDIRNREPFFFKSWKEKYNNIPMTQAARATSAAPTYFEPVVMKLQCEQEHRVLIDGGVFINSPAVSAYAEARREFGDNKKYFVVSLGTGELTRSYDYYEAIYWGKIQWIRPLLSSMFDGVADAASYQMDKFLGEDNYIRLQIDLSNASDDMDNVRDGNINLLVTEAKTLIEQNEDKIDNIIYRLS